jgi:geranylgeranyl pyrophosphate synthase
MPLPDGVEQRLGGALRHVLGHPGNLVRPRIVLQMSAAYGLPETASEELAVALEYFHSASLLFDDLPSMDDASHRRGVSCTHLLFGESSAILAALALINRAYMLIWRAVSACPRDVQMRALSYIERNLGVDGLLNGQSLDLHYSELPHNLKTADRIARGKTVSLIRLPLVLPAILGGASDAELRRLERIALYWGLSYQIVDDLKDVLQSATQAGKTVAHDISLDRPNMAATIGVGGAVARVGRLIGLGDRMLRRVLRHRPALGFLERLRADLEAESARVIQNACALKAR